MSLNVLGLDLGLAHVGAAQLHQNGRVYTWRLDTQPLPDNAPIADVTNRIHTVTRWAISRGTTSTTLAVLEAPSYASQHGQPHERGGVWWATARGLIRAGVPVASVAPRSLKAKIGGPNATKEIVRDALARMYPGNGIHRISLDESDALGLAVLGVAKLAICTDGWTGPWLEARALNLDTGCRWPTELTPAPRPQPPAVANPFGDQA